MQPDLEGVATFPPTDPGAPRNSQGCEERQPRSNGPDFEVRWWSPWGFWLRGDCLYGGGCKSGCGGEMWLAVTCGPSGRAGDAGKPAAVVPRDRRRSGLGLSERRPGYEPAGLVQQLPRAARRRVARPVPGASPQAPCEHDQLEYGEQSLFSSGWTEIEVFRAELVSLLENELRELGAAGFERT